MLLQRGLIRLVIVRIPAKTTSNRVLHRSIFTAMLRQFNDEILGIDLKSGPLYIKLKSCRERESTTCESVTANVTFFNDKQVYYLNSFVDSESFAKNIVRHRDLERSLKTIIPSKKSIALFQGTIHSKSIFQRCMFLALNTEVNDSERANIRNEIKQLAQRFQTGCVMEPTQPNILEVGNIVENNQQISYEVSFTLNES